MNDLMTLETIAGEFTFERVQIDDDTFEIRSGEKTINYLWYDDEGTIIYEILKEKIAEWLETKIKDSEFVEEMKVLHDIGLTSQSNRSRNTLRMAAACYSRGKGEENRKKMKDTYVSEIYQLFSYEQRRVGDEITVVEIPSYGWAHQQILKKLLLNMYSKLLKADLVNQTWESIKRGE